MTTLLTFTLAFGLDLDAKLPPCETVVAANRQSVTILCLTYEAKLAASQAGDADAIRLTEANHLAASKAYRFWMLCRWRHEQRGGLLFWIENSQFLREKLRSQ